MNRLNHLPTNLKLMIALIVSLSVQPAYAQGASQAKVLEIMGDAQYLKAGSADWAKLDQGVMLSEGDKLKTGPESQVRLELTGNQKTAELVIRKDTEFSLATFRHDEANMIDSTLLDVEIGSVLVKAEKLIGSSKFEVKTPTSIVGIRGTTFEVNVSKG